MTRFSYLPWMVTLGETRFTQYEFCSALLNAVEKTNKVIYNITADARPRVFPVHTLTNKLINGPRNPERADMASYYLINKLVLTGRFKILWPGLSIPDTLSNIDNIVTSNFSEYFGLGYIAQPRGSWSYDYIYGGMAVVHGRRKDRILELTNLCDRYSVGKSKINGFTSLSNHKGVSPNEKYLEVMSKAKLQIVFGEPWHNFTSIRFWECALGGSLIGIDSTYKSAVETAKKIGLDDHHILTTGEDTLKLLQTSDVYQSQVDKTIKYLSEGLPPAILL